MLLTGCFPHAILALRGSLGGAAGLGDSMRLIGGMTAPAFRVAKDWYGGAYWRLPGLVFSALNGAVAR